MTTGPLTVDGLERWVLFGAQWRVVHLADEQAVVELCTCAGEPVERLSTEDPALISYLRSARPNPEATREEGSDHDDRHPHRLG